ncbi:hypothetical protein FNH22_29380 [Fulvivirga sp. M361]|uniref:C1 family peptidase n=1 Tax=Fulvivirga sp. M361 TaxID=2594266 RepID=UPI00117B7F51|nr:C1 family peptidase [Fulvivirga sp. M361]TRX48288.1 hypothetical protein FNH22_29380 [Fulvivirga sp. M361]
MDQFIEVDRSIKGSFFPFILCFVSSVSLAQQCPIGLDFNENEYKAQALPALQHYGLLPTSFSLKKYCPKPTTQLSFKTSAGWASAYYAMTILNARDQELTDPELITKGSFAPVYIYENLLDNNCERSTSIGKTLDALKSVGVPKFIDYPFYCPEGIIGKAGLERQKLSGYVKLFDRTSERKVEAIKRVLAKGNPVVVGLSVAPTLCSASDLWRPYESLSTQYDGHALCVLGYNDHLYGGSFEVVNSWGSAWGNKGFTNIKYSDLEKWVFSGYQLSHFGEYSDVQISIEGKLSHGALMGVKFLTEGKYTFKKSYPSGTAFGFDITNNFACYLFITYCNDSGDYGKLFPASGSESSILPYQDNCLSFPTRENHIRLDNQKGKESITFIFSRTELNSHELKKYTLQPNERPPDFSWEKDKIKMSTINYLSGPPIVIQIMLDHI